MCVCVCVCCSKGPSEFQTDKKEIDVLGQQRTARLFAVVSCYTSLSNFSLVTPLCHTFTVSRAVTVSKEA